jgi:glutamate-1-semialdehyde 2,1-aminomutase
MGKIIGGGLPIGAFGGREDLMRMFHPDQPEPVMHASTFSGNPLSMAAGFAAMNALNPQVTERLNALGERLRVGIGAAFARHGIRGQATGIGSLANIHLTDAKLNGARDSLAGNLRSGRINQLLHLEMLKRGVASAARLMYCTSTAMANEDVDFALAALDDALKSLKPGIAKEKRELLV